MNHLTSEHLDSALHNQATAATLAHLDTCEACAEELASMRSLLTSYRESIAAAPLPVIVANTSRGTHTARLGVWGMALATLTLVAVLVPHQHNAAPVTQTSTSTPEVASISDDALLESVQNDVVKPMSDSLLPLTPTETSGTTSSTSKGNTP